MGLSYEARPSGPVYRIVSDTEDATVPNGFCIVEGSVIDQSGRKITHALISTLSKNDTTRTDLAGNYSLQISEIDSVIFMFHPEYGEIVIQKYDFKSGHRVVIQFTPDSPYHENQMVKKPVIYLYGAQGSKVSIALTHPGMTFTYPAYEDGWNVEIGEQGNLIDQNTGNSYPYLFWEATTSNLTYTKSENNLEGFLLKTDTLVSFFEDVLAQSGLNEKEQTDFITFWAPQLIETPFVFIQFLFDETYNSQVASIAVNPLPQSQRRLFMLYTPLMTPTEFPYEVNQQSIPAFVRSGLTLVEWGGAAIELKRMDEN